MAGRLLDYLGQGTFAARPVAATLSPKITAGGLALYFANDTDVLYLLDTTGPTWLTVSGGGGGGLTDGDYGDVTVSGGGTVITIDSATITAAKLAASAIALFEPAGAITTHEGLANPHPIYLTQAEGDALYAIIAHTHTASQITDFSASADARIALHSAAADPHPIYLTLAEANAVYSVTGHTHVIADVTGLATALADKLDDSQATAYGLSILGVANAAAAKGLLVLVKADVGLGNVDNTSDVNKPVSTAQATAIGLKLDSSAVSAFGLTLIDDANAAAARTTLGLGTAATSAIGDFAAASHTHVLADVTGLVTALAGKEPTIGAGTITQYWRGDKTFQTLDKTAVGLGNVDNTADANKPVSTATQTALNLKQDISTLSEAIDDRVAALLVAGTDITLTYNDAANTLTIDSIATGVGGGVLPLGEVMTIANFQFMN